METFDPNNFNPKVNPIKQMIRDGVPDVYRTKVSNSTHVNETHINCEDLVSVFRWRIEMETKQGILQVSLD